MAEQQDREVWVPKDIIRQNFHTRRGPLERERGEREREREGGREGAFQG